jgi:hypothetical protein
MSELNNPAASVVDEFSRNWEKFSAPMVEEIYDQIGRGVPVTTAVNNTFYKYNVKKEFRNSVLAGIISSVEKSGIDIKSEIGIKSWFLDKTWNPGEMTLSSKINKLEFKQIAINEIQKNFKDGKTFTRVAKSLTDIDFTKADLPKHLTELTSLARRVAAGDTQALREYTKQLRKSIERVEALAQDGAPNTALKKAYENVISASETFAEEQLNKAVDRAILQKARYNAERIARTEMARAYGVGKQTQANEDPDVIGLKWNLSTRHPQYDICDFNAKADLYDAGAGVYPKDQFPQFPAHPHCLCVITEVYGEEQLTFRKDVQEGGQKFLDDLPPEDRQSLLGKAGMNKTKDWQDNMRMFQKKELPTLPSGTYIPPATATKEAKIPKPKKEPIVRMDISAATTNEDAIKAFQNNNPKVKIDFPQIYLKKTTLDTMKSTLTQHEKVINDFPFLKSKGGKRITMQYHISKSRNVWAWADGKRVSVCPNYMTASSADLNLGLKSSEQSGYHPKGCDTWESVMTHELGHNIQFRLRGAWESDLRKKFGDEWYTNFKKWEIKLEDTKMTGLNSRYSQKDSMEGFAEAFAAYYHTPPNLLPEWVKEFIKEVIEPIKGVKFR